MTIQLTPDTEVLISDAVAQGVSSSATALVETAVRSIWNPASGPCRGGYASYGERSKSRGFHSSTRRASQQKSQNGVGRGSKDIHRMLAF